MSDTTQLRFYETMFIIKPTLVEEEIRAKIDFFKDVITKNGGHIETCLDMGMRQLAYEIKKCQRGYYFVIYFKANSILVKELVRLYRINEEILRFIVISYKKKKWEKAWHTLVDRANKKTEKGKSLRKDDHSKNEDRLQEQVEDEAKLDANSIANADSNSDKEQAQ